MIHGRIMKAISLGLLLVASAAEAKKFDAVPGEYVVKLKNGFAAMSVNTLEQSLGAEVVEHLSVESQAVLVRKSQIEKSEFAIQSLKQNPMVEYAEPNFIYKVIGGSTSLPNDQSLERLWGMINTGQTSTGDMGNIVGRAGIDIDAKRAWQIETGSNNVLVASIDTGVDYTIPDLAPNMWVNAAEKNGQAGVDDDNNGVVDDVYGYNAITDSGDPKDDHGHGSHTSGTIGAKGNNGLGVTGVAWNVSLMGVKFLSASGGGTLADAVKAVDYTTKMKVDMTNNSWGGGGYSEALYDAIKRARDAGILFVAAAGNSGSNNDLDPEYPASYDLDNIISVAALDNAGSMAYFSCYGRTAVDVAAPGVNVLSTTPGGFDSWSGTSMASPHVAGVAALLKSANPEMGYAEIKERIIKTASPLGSMRNKVVAGGMVNAYHALMNTVPAGDPNDPFNWDKNAVKVSTPHPYTDKYKGEWTVSSPGATKIALYFSRFDTEMGYDKVTIKDKTGKVVAVLSGVRDDSFSPVIDGDTAYITFEADDSATRYGFDIEGVAYK
ncbi:MAG: S8 family serine peptidase [Bdellovibrionales bacterium]